MQICRELAGYSLGRADLVRRAMAKKKRAEMEKERIIFIEGSVDEKGNVLVDGALRRGVSREAAEKIFSEIEVFSEYAFNKSHAAAYALVSYETAYLKYHYPREYMSALLTSVLNELSMVARYIAECQRINIKVLPPHVNYSEQKFTVQGNDIRFGLLAIKNIGAGFVDTLIREREKNGEYKDFYSFCERLYGKDTNRRSIESLIKSGAMDGLAESRNQMLSSIDMVMADLDRKNNGFIEGQMGIFDLIAGESERPRVELAKVKELPVEQLLAMEKEVTELYLSGHPMAQFSVTAEKLSTDKMGDILSMCEDKLSGSSDGKRVNVLALVSSVKTKMTKGNDMMAFVQLEDVTGRMEMLVFPRIFTEYRALLNEGSVIFVRGRLSVRDDDDEQGAADEPKIICEQIFNLESVEKRMLQHGNKSTAHENHADKPKTASKNPGLYLKVTSFECDELEKAKKVLRIFDGATAVYVYSTDDKILRLAPRELCVFLNDVMVKELKNILGEENVVIKY